MGKSKLLQLTDAQRLSLEEGFRNGDTHYFRMRCRAVLLKETSLKPRYRITNGDVTYLQLMDEMLRGVRNQGSTYASQTWVQTYHGLFRRSSRAQSYRTR